MATTETKTIRVWQSTYNRIEKMQEDEIMPKQLTSDAQKIDWLLDNLERSYNLLRVFNKEGKQ